MSSRPIDSRKSAADLGGPLVVQYSGLAQSAPAPKPAAAASTNAALSLKTVDTNAFFPAPGTALGTGNHAVEFSFAPNKTVRGFVQARWSENPFNSATRSNEFDTKPSDASIFPPAIRAGLQVNPDVGSKTKLQLTGYHQRNPDGSQIAGGNATVAHKLGPKTTLKGGVSGEVRLSEANNGAKPLSNITATMGMDYQPDPKTKATLELEGRYLPDTGDTRLRATAGVTHTSKNNETLSAQINYFGTSQNGGASGIRLDVRAEDPKLFNVNGLSGQASLSLYEGLSGPTKRGIAGQVAIDADNVVAPRTEFFADAQFALQKNVSGSERSVVSGEIGGGFVVSKKPEVTVGARASFKDEETNGSEQSQLRIGAYVGVNLTPQTELGITVYPNGDVAGTIRRDI